jgi:hypothetical protein
MAPRDRWDQRHQQPSPAPQADGLARCGPCLAHAQWVAVGAASALPIQRHNTGSMAATGGCGWRLWTAWMARCRMASGLRAGIPSPWRVKACAVTAKWCPAGRGGVDAAHPLGRGEGAFGLGAVDHEAAGLPAYPATRQARAPLVAVGDRFDQRSSVVDRIAGFDPVAESMAVSMGGWIASATAGRSPAAKLERASRTQVRNQRRTADGFTWFCDRRRYGTSTPLRWRPPTSWGSEEST